MNKCVIFDSNFLYENKDFNKLFSLKKDDEDFFVTDLVINEIKSKNDRELRDMHDKYDEIVKSNLNQVYFKLKNKLDLGTMYSASSKKIQEYFEIFFKENIIYGYSKEKMYDELMERVRFKKAPFFDQDNSSDKGFKDTLIWMSILNYVKESEYIEFIVVTNDKGFLKKQNKILIEEFNKEFSDKTISIISNNDFLKNKNGNDNKDIKNEKEINPIINERPIAEKRISEQIVSEAKNSIYSFFYYTEYGNPYEFEKYELFRFVMSKRPDYQETVDFIDSLVKVRDDYTFHDEVNVVNILKDLGYQNINQRENIPINVFNDFLNTFLVIKNDYPTNFDALIQYCIDNFCEVKSIEIELEEDLPF